MDSALWVPVAGAVIGLVGTIITVVLSNRNNRKILELKLEEIRRDESIRYREQELSIARLIAPRSIDAIQEAFAMIMEVNTLLCVGLPSAADSADYDRCHEKLKEMRRWYDHNCLYIPHSIQESFLKLMNLSHQHFGDLESGRTIQRRTDVWESLHDATESVQQAIDDFMKKYNLLETSTD